MKFHIPPSDLLKSETQVKIVKFLLSHEAAMSEREIASVLDVSHMSINRTMQELSELNFVHYIVVGKAHLWKVNRHSYAYRMFDKLIRNIEVWADPMIELKQIIIRKLPLRGIKRVVIFGSVAQNTEKTNSDIDVFIMTRDAASQKKVEEIIESLSGECLEAFGNRLSPYILTEYQYNQKKETDIISELNKGIQIYP